MKPAQKQSSMHDNFFSPNVLRPRLGTLLVGLALLGNTAQGFAASVYTMAELPITVPGSITGFAPLALSANGQIVGRGTNLLNVYPLYTATPALFDPANGSLTDIQALSNGGTLSDTWDLNINASGQIAGTGHVSGYYAPGNTPHAFVRDVNGAGIDLGLLPSHDESHAYAINDNGQVVGQSLNSSTSSCDRKAFLANISGGGIKSLGTLGGEVSSASAINNKGQIVGSSSISLGCLPGTAYHAFVTTPSGLQDLHGAGMGVSSAASGINDNGYAVGGFDTGLLTVAKGSRYPNGLPIYHAVIWDTTKGGYTDLGIGTNASSLSSINTNGDVIGGEWIYGTANFLYTPTIVSSYPVVGNVKGGGLTDLNTLLVGNTAGWVLQSAIDINDAGQILATAKDSAGVQHIVRLTPSVAPVSPLPSAPSNLISTAISRSLVSLKWADNATNEQNFLIERCKGSNCTNFSQIALVAANVTTYSDKAGLSRNTLYSYQVRASNASGKSAYSNTLSVKTLP